MNRPRPAATGGGSGAGAWPAVLFADLAAAFAGAPRVPLPGLGEVRSRCDGTFVLLVEHYASVYPADAETRACRDIRKHVAWYLKGYVVGHEVRARLGLVESLAGFDLIVAELDVDQPHPGRPAQGPRGAPAALAACTCPRLAGQPRSGRRRRRRRADRRAVGVGRLSARRA